MVVSVIIPAYKARETIGSAIESVRQCGLDAKDVEIVVSVDDGQRYDGVIDEGCVLVDDGQVRTGPGPARNRGIERASGDYIAFLDADDRWEPGYLSTLLPLARRDGAAFSRTRVCDKTGEVVVLPVDHERLTFAAMAQSGGSFWPVARRELVGPFLTCPSQDIVHSLEVLSLIGGSAALAGTYRLQLNGDSVTAVDDFTALVAREYRAIIEVLRKGKTRIPSSMTQEAIWVYERKIEINDAFDARGAGRSFYGFVADEIRGS